MHIKPHISMMIMIIIYIYIACEDLGALILEKRTHISSINLQALLYAVAPDLDQLSELEAQLKQEKGTNNK